MDSKITRAQLNNFDLHQYALLGDDEGVLRALQNGANINMLDSAGRTAIMCAVAGEKWHEIDAYDASFMSPKRLNALKIMLQHPQVTLHTLNATNSSMNGVIALGMAAWLNQVDAVRTLLDESLDGVSVDGMDAYGATALMYAARDGSLDVVQALLSHGARPDFRDRNHRTSIQFSMPYPQILWLCETTLRHHRWRESNAAERTRLSTQTEYLVELIQASLVTSTTLEPPPVSIFTPDSLARMTHTLISCTRSGDLSFLHSVLFSPSLPASSPPSLYPLSVPVLVNHPDASGWSPIHHCVASPQPSIDILDALYCAGADISLFTTDEQQTPLHILSRTAHSAPGNPDTTQSLHDFCIHLIRDLRAPLSARDRNDETCLHVAAEHGHSADFLLLLLDCDTSGNVRQMKNSRGLTPYEVCKTDFLFAFGSPNDGARPESALSNHTIRPTQSFASLSSVSENYALSLSPPNTPASNSGFHMVSFPALPSPSPTTDSSSITAPFDIDAEAATQQLLVSLRMTSANVSHSRSPSHIMDLQAHIDDVSEQCDLLVQHYRGRIEDAVRVVEELEQVADRVGEVRQTVRSAAKKQISARGVKAVPCRRRPRDRDSEDSQATMASMADVLSRCGAEAQSLAPTSIMSVSGMTHVSVGTQTSLLDRFAAANSVAQSDLTWVNDLVEPSDTAADLSRARFTGLWAVERDLEQLQRPSTLVAPMPLTMSSNANIKVGMKLKQVLRKKKKLEEQILALDADVHAHIAKKDPNASGTARVKAWIRRMVGPFPPAKLEIVYDLDSSNVGRDVKKAPGTGESDNDEKNPCLAIQRDFQDVSMDMALKTSQVVLEAVHRDLQAVYECLQSARNFIDMANHSISRTQRVVKRALKKREALLESLRTNPTHAITPGSPGETSLDDSLLSPGLLGFENALSQRPSLASISTIYSTNSTTSSIGAATVTESDDEDIKIIRRILLRKIDAQMSGIWDEVDTSNSWLHIVKESVRSVKRRAYL